MHHYLPILTARLRPHTSMHLLLLRRLQALPLIYQNLCWRCWKGKSCRSNTIPSRWCVSRAVSCWGGEYGVLAQFSAFTLLTETSYLGMIALTIRLSIPRYVLTPKRLTASWCFYLVTHHWRRVSARNGSSGRQAIPTSFLPNAHLRVRLFQFSLEAYWYFWLQ